MILFVSGEYPPDVGGVGDYTLHLRAALSDLGWPSGVAARDHVRRWDARGLLWLARTAPTSGVVHIQFQAGAYDLLGDVCLMPALLRRLRRHVRTVTTFHDTRVPYLFPRAGALRPMAVRFLARTSHAVIAADQRDLNWLGGSGHHVPIGSNVRCSPPAGYQREAFRAGLGLQADDLAVVHFGLLNAGKGLDLLLGAFRRLREQRPSARLFLLGGGPREWPCLAELGDRVVNPGWLSPTDLSAYLLAGDVALLPYVDGASARRGSLLACAEHALPIVSTQPAGEEVAPFIAAVEPAADSLSAAVLNAFTAPEALRAASRRLAHLSGWPRIAAAHVDIYNRLLHSQR